MIKYLYKITRTTKARSIEKFEILNDEKNIIRFDNYNRIIKPDALTINGNIIKHHDHSTILDIVVVAYTSDVNLIYEIECHLDIIIDGIVIKRITELQKWFVDCGNTSKTYTCNELSDDELSQYKETIRTI